MICKTERLILRRLELTDAPFIVQLLNSPGWLQFIGDRGVRTIDQAEKYLINGPFASYEKNGFGLWLVERAKDSAPVGMCGLLKRDYLPHPDIGFAFLPAYTNHGYATECIAAVIALAKAEFKLAIVAAITTPDNVASINTLRKNGFQFIREIMNEDRQELNLFERNLLI